MEVILTKPIKNLGTIGTLVNVKPGFGRNYLLPQALAIRATSENKKYIEEQKQNLEEQNKQLIKEAQDLATKINGKDITFIQACSDDGRLFGSVNKKEIVKEFFLKHNCDVSHNMVLLEAPLKTLGVFEVDFGLHADVSAKIIVNIARSATEAQKAIQDYKNDKNASSGAALEQ